MAAGWNTWGMGKAPVGCHHHDERGSKAGMGCGRGAEVVGVWTTPSRRSRILRTRSRRRLSRLALLHHRHHHNGDAVVGEEGWCADGTAVVAVRERYEREEGRGAKGEISSSAVRRGRQRQMVSWPARRR